MEGKKFLSYPEPKRGPDVAYRNERKQNPTMSGLVLLVATFVFEYVGMIRKLIWKNAGFASLRKIRKQLEDYEPRVDPTVVPTSTLAEQPAESSEPELVSTAIEPAAKYYSVQDYHNLYLSGELTPTAVARAILPLIRRDTTPPGEHSTAWFETRVDLVLAAAAASTSRYKKGCPLGLLDGIPTAVKDEYDMDGYKTCLGSLNDYSNEPAPQGGTIASWCVRKLEEAGAVVLGKLSMHEFGLDTSGNNPNYGTPLNPYNPKYYTGGSSSGSAYAVSAGLIPFALGSDGGGSIRIPSSFCSVYGLKPSHNRISHHPGPNHSNTCAVNGPIAADLQSLSALYRVIGCPPSSSPFLPVHPRLAPLSAEKKYLGVPEGWFSQATPAIQKLCRSAISNIVDKYNYTVVPIEIPFLIEGQIAHALTILTDAATLLPDTTNLTFPNKLLLGLGTVTPATDYLLAQKLRRLLMQHLAWLWKEYPGMIIVTPTTGCAGWPIRHQKELKYGISDGDQTLKTMDYIWLANFTGLPAINVPAGFVVPEGAKDEGEIAQEDTEGKIPIGLMGTGEWGSEDYLMHFGLDVENVVADRRSKPPVWVDVVAKAKEEMDQLQHVDSRQVPALPLSTGRNTLSTSLPHLDKALIPPAKQSANAAANTAESAPAASQFVLQGWSQLAPNAGAVTDSGNGNSNGNGNVSDEKPPSMPGIQRGEVTEISGPRGTGKTSLAMTTAVNALERGESVVWIDTAGPLCATRLEKMLSTNNTPTQRNDLLRNLLHLQPTTLAHLMTLISFPVPGFPPANTGLIVVDSISCLFGSEFRSKLPIKLSKAADLSRAEKAKDGQESKLWWKLIGNLASNLNGLASRFDCAVIVVNEVVTRFRPGRKPMLHASISGYTWETNVATRILLYWHWLGPEVREKVRMKRIRIAEVFKAGMMSIIPRVVTRIVPFLVHDAGLSEFTQLSIRLGVTAGMDMAPQPMKRKLDHQLSSEIPRRPKIEHDNGNDNDDGEHETENEDKSASGKPAEPVLATACLPTEIMDSQDEEEEDEWLDTSLAIDIAKSGPEPGPTTPGKGEDDTELLLRSMVEGDV
ncbi:glutamyl-tRNA(Gln) amidotransferase subunit A [Arthroderma uncinatum]|uniref:glutamyl-tRNA(Gln) amidotransferase subunit A n=1 Tax=Arthroderma uncinatum TaxID=74035 RepID=UPI00144A9F5C|nr:glutamyl-tRNA(Gln) amidotransferase subunit A [Arthroderma uncinatum]KAF3480561.1 glutamyl-tRNA(Gln) amidotransferase subunit A [Arthroderma uncinatum]